jgi:cytochrome oxidase Cu insertion factor (SCO1/SenC/PrrC family)
MEFAPPAAGTYTLQKIQPVAEAALLDSAGRAIKLSSVTTAKITLLTFFYTYCADPLGCPLAYQIFSELRDRLVRDARMAQQVRFVSVSLDPTNDTPAAIASYSSVISGNPNFEWRFLTAQSVGQLLPVLEDFGQDVSIERAADGTPTRTLHHMLKVFLIDRGAMVREIYSLAYLQPEVIFNDLQTLLLERRSERLAHR